MEEETKNTRSDNIKAELAYLSKLYKTRTAALEKMSTAMLEEKQISEESRKISND